MKGKVLGRARKLVLTEEQFKKLAECTTGQGGYQSLCQRIHDSVKILDGKYVAHVYETDMDRMYKAAQRSDSGTWQELCRAILAANP